MGRPQFAFGSRHACPRDRSRKASLDAATEQPSDVLKRHIYMPPRSLVSVLVLAVLGACSSDQTPPSRAVPTDKGDPLVDASVPRCSEDIPFEPTYLPQGFRHEVFVGPFPRGRAPDDLASSGIGEPHEEQVIVHYRGSGRRAIEVRRPGTLFTELAQGDDAPTIEVLGARTSGFAPISPYGNEFMVQFSYPPHETRKHQWCRTYSLNEYSVPLAELTKVAEGLRVRAPDRPFRLLIHCGLSIPLEFDGRNWLPADKPLRRTHNPPDGFGGDENYDMGTIRRIDKNTIIYTSSEGREIEYEPTTKRAEVCE